ncbi:MAG: homocysteine S-methyltransferase family protein [Syntrophothermus sp.]
MNFRDTVLNGRTILSEGSVVERVKRSNPELIDDRLSNSVMIYSREGNSLLETLYRQYIDIAVKHDLPVIILTPTWRASRQRLGESGYLDRDVNGDNFRFLEGIRRSYGSFSPKIFIGGLMGCANDAYKPEEALNYSDALSFHNYQIDALARAGVDFLLAATLPEINEASAIAELMSRTGLPYIISFVTGKNAAVLDGTTLFDAIKMIDGSTRPSPFFYMANCVHPSSFIKNACQLEDAFKTGRFRGIQANASRKSPDELDGLAELDAEDPEELSDSIIKLCSIGGLVVLGGCCGTDDRHIEAIASKLII